MVEEFKKMLGEIVGVDIESIDFKKAYEKDGIENDFVVKMMICSRLERIAEALEGLNESGNLLSNCVGYVPPRWQMKEGFHILRIGGQVDTE